MTNNSDLGPDTILTTHFSLQEGIEILQKIIDKISKHRAL